MQVVILAAGTGSRLKNLTTRLPKALVEVAGRPLIDYAINFAQATDADRIAVVGGFCFNDLKNHIESKKFNVAILENRDYLKGNILTLGAAMPHLSPTGGCLIMNTDHIYKPTIASLVAKNMMEKERVTAFCDFDRQLGADDMKVSLNENRRVTAMSKTLAEFDCGYVGMSFVPGPQREIHLRAMQEVIEEKGEGSVVEQILGHMASTGHAPDIVDISGHGWLEVDEPHEREKAEAVLIRERWWG